MRSEAQESGARAHEARGPAVTVPYIAPWTAERRRPDAVISLSGLRGIGYLDEVPHDRNSRGVLWIRSALAPGKGRPRFGAVHPARQRRAMRRLLCQVCAGPADRNEQGVLWLLGAGEGDWPNWPEGMAASHPPVCLPCAAVSTNLCPHLRRSYVAVRVREPEVSGVLGIVHRPGPRGPVRVTDDIVKYGDARMPWVLASQQLMLLKGCSFIDLDAELSAAGLLPPHAAPSA